MSLQANLTWPAYEKKLKEIVTCAASPRAAVLEIRIAPKCFDTMYIIYWMAQSSKNCQEFFCSFSVLCLLCRTELFTQWCSLQNISVLYIWLNMLNCSFEGCSVLLFRQPVVNHTLLPNLLVVSYPLPLVTAYWWNKHFLTMIRILTTFSHRNLCSLFYPYAVFLFTQHLYALYK